MSRRITNQLNITDRELAAEALKLADCKFEQHGEHTLFIASGMFRHATVDLKTGTITGDSDYGHSEESFGLLRQYYAEAQIRLECLKNGTTIEEKQTDSEGNIILLAHMA